MAEKHVCNHICSYMKYCEAYPLGWNDPKTPNQKEIKLKIRKLEAELKALNKQLKKPKKRK